MKSGRISNATLYKITFILSFSILCFVTILYFEQLKKVDYAQQHLIRSRERQIELAKLLNLVKEAESVQRAYLLTEDSTYIKSYTTSHRLANKSFKKLKSLSNSNDKRERDLKRLSMLISQRFEIMDSVLKNHSAGTAIKTGMNSDLKLGFYAMQRISELSNKIFISENAALRRYERLHNDNNVYFPYITGVLVLFCIVLLVLSFYKINRDYRRIGKMNHDLLIMNQSFSQAEEMSAMGHWKRDLATGIIEPSANMYRLLGVEPHSIPYNEKMLLQFIHPDDRDRLIKTFENVRSTHTAPDVSYRIIRPDGTLRHFKTEARFINPNNMPIMLGSTRDVTEEIENNSNIEKKNRELEEMVKELASFNHAASHDLQEPLRKIQVFISRILEEDADSLSADSKDYFSRITSSAARMEMLIDDLLLYSETGKEGHVFETTDLNQILIEAQQELLSEIEAKKAVIHAARLPILPVIPFQMRQMFINIIGNALKYSKTDVPAEINISCKKVKRQFPGSSHKTYYKIKIDDNGIGFLQEYAEKIFVIFHRLHNKTKYSGTGIGLAICKKIVENHNGYIIAKSSPGKGATFIIYLPK